MKAGAYLLLAAYLALSSVAYLATQQPESIGARMTPCGDSLCVSWVMPAGLAWETGVRPGMRVVSANGSPVDAQDYAAIGPLPVGPLIVQDLPGRDILVAPRESSLAQRPVKFTLWGLGALFALLGAAVAWRRPDSNSARMFALFAGSSALALAVGPAADGPKHTWALIVQVFTMLPIGPLCLGFVASFIGYAPRLYREFVVPLVVAVGAVIAIGYVAAIAVDPNLYEWVRRVLYLYASSCLFGSILLLAIVGRKQPSPMQRQQARLALAGIAFGTIPFAWFVLIPEALGIGTIVPIHLAALAVAFVPIFFAYAILQFQLLGIRSLVHRGMVYAIASVSLLGITSFALAWVLSALSDVGNGRMPVLALSAVVVAGALLFHPLRYGARKLVDRVMYGEVVNYQRIFEAVRRDLLAPSDTQEVAGATARMFLNSLRLESVLVFLGDSPSSARLVKAEGERYAEVLMDCYPKIRPESDDDVMSELADVHWQSESLLLVTLSLPGSYLGHMLLGPKRRGEIFLEEEKQLVRTIAPILALALEKSEQSKVLRHLNQQLVNATEAERGRIAQDLHDGPLQKAMLLAGIGGSKLQDPAEVARQLASDLREICSRLRPAILDDLGIVSSLEWVLDDVASRYGLSTTLALENVDEDDRFAPEIELALFRITQEAANNAVKHARGTSLTVTLAQTDGIVGLTVADDGKGLLPDPRRVRGFGISGMSERAAQLGGTLEIKSVPGAGTTVIARIPVKAHA